MRWVVWMVVGACAHGGAVETLGVAPPPMRRVDVDPARHLAGRTLPARVAAEADDVPTMPAVSPLEVRGCPDGGDVTVRVRSPDGAPVDGARVAFTTPGGTVAVRRTMADGTTCAPPWTTVVRVTAASGAGAPRDLQLPHPTDAVGVRLVVDPAAPTGPMLARRPWRAVKALTAVADRGDRTPDCGTLAAEEGPCSPGSWSPPAPPPTPPSSPTASPSPPPSAPR